MAKRQHKKVYRFELDITDPVERELIDTLDGLTGRYRFSDFMRQLLAMSLTNHYQDTIASVMHRPPHSVIPYQKPARQAQEKPVRKSDQTIKAIEEKIESADDALARATANVLATFGGL